MNNETERAAFENRYMLGDKSKEKGDMGEYLNIYVQFAWEGWQARAALPTTGGEVVRDALTVIRDLDAISMALAARLTGMGSKITGGHEYLLRDAVMREVVEWRRQWDANSAARQDFAGLLRATHRPEPAQPDSGKGEA